MLKLSPTFEEVTVIVPVARLQVGFVTATVGAPGGVLGAAVTVARALAHPLMVAIKV